MRTHWQRFLYATPLGCALRLLPWRLRWFWRQLVRSI